MSYLIESGIELPARKSTKLRDTVSKMKSGDSIVVPSAEANNLYLRTYKALASSGRRGMTIVIRNINKRGDARLWLVSRRRPGS